MIYKGHDITLEREAILPRELDNEGNEIQSDNYWPLDDAVYIAKINGEENPALSQPLDGWRTLGDLLEAIDELESEKE